MSYHEFILVVNFSSIIILVLLAMLLLIATRFRGESGYAAAIIVLPNIPVYIYNMSRMLGWHDITLFFFPISYSVNTLLMPLLWLFTRRNFDLDPRFKPVQLLHFLPAIVCVVIVLSIPMRKRMESILHEVTGDDTWIGDFNAAVITSQMIGYFVAIFIYLYRKKQYIKDNWSDAEYMQKEWIPKLMILFAALFVTVMTCYAIWPRTDAWLIQILNVMAMSFLVYSITYDKNDAQEQKDVYICDGNKSVVRIDSYKWNSSSSDWVYDGKTVMENDNQGRTLVAISYSAADVAGEKTEYTYTGNGYEKFSVTSSSFEGGAWKAEAKVDIEATFNKDKYPVSILMTGTAEGETFKMKMEWSYDKNVTKTSSSIDFGGSWMLMSESKTEIVDAGNPMISKNYQKMYFPAETSWEYSGKTHDYFNGTTSIAPVVEENELKLHIYGDVLEVQGTESGISIYAITGGKMAESKSNRIDISRLPAGIYLLNTARGSIKFIHK